MGWCKKHNIYFLIPAPLEKTSGSLASTARNNSDISPSTGAPPRLSLSSLKHNCHFIMNNLFTTYCFLAKLSWHHYITSCYKTFLCNTQLKHYLFVTSGSNRLKKADICSQSYIFSVEACLSRVEICSTKASSASSSSFLDFSESFRLYNRLLLLRAFCRGVGNGSSGNTVIKSQS